MAIDLMGLRLVTLVVLVNFICVRNQVTNKELWVDTLLEQPFGGRDIADILDIQSYGTEYKDVERKRNFTTPALRISEIKCLEYIWDIVQKERHGKPLVVCDSRIVGGCRPALYGEFSHMGAVGWRSLENGEDRWVYKCGASLISNKFLITAAHCSRLPQHDRSVSNHVPEVVKLGDKFINKEDGRNIESQIIWIERFIKYPHYVSPNHYFDIALIELRESVNFGPLIRPACLWTSRDTSAFEYVQVSGWGEISPCEISDELQVGNIGIIDDGYCDTLLKKKHNRKWSGLSEHQLCAGVLSGSIDTCRGDSGGPLQAKINIPLRWPVYYLIGVTSFSYGCMRPNVPGVYVKVASFVNWIESIVWPEIYK